MLIPMDLAGAMAGADLDFLFRPFAGDDVCRFLAVALSSSLYNCPMTSPKSLPMLTSRE